MATFDQLQATGYNLTEKEVAAQGRKLVEVYKAALDDIRDEIERFYGRVMAGLVENETYIAMRSARYKKLLEDITTLYTQAARKAKGITADTSRLAMTNNFYRQQYALSWVTRDPLPFTQINAAVVEVVALGEPEIWADITKNALDRIEREYGNPGAYQPRHGTLTDTLAKNASADVAKLKNALASGITQGQSFRQMAQGVKKILDTSASNALRVVRTESMRAMNAGHYANYQTAKAAGADIYRQVLSTLDTRTREQSIEVDGITDKDHPGYFVYPGGAQVAYPGNSGVAAWDINDRERVINVVPGHEPQSRRGRNPQTGRTEVMSFVSYPEWAEKHGVPLTK